MNPQPIEKLYNSFEGLDYVEMCEVMLKHCRTDIEIRIELPRFPDNPPSRWHQQHNTAQAVLSFFDIKNVLVKGWGTEIMGHLTLDKRESELDFVFASEKVSVSFTCLYGRIEQISSYINNPLRI